MEISFQKKQAQLALEIIQNTILELLKKNPDGLRNSEISRQLGLESMHQGAQKDYLVYSILGQLLDQKLIEKTTGKPTLYKIIKRTN